MPRSWQASSHISPYPSAPQLTPSEEERLQILTEPEAIAKKIAKDKNQAPFEFFKSQVAPFDVLPFVKANHWCTVQFDLRANLDDYDGGLQTNPVMLVGMPQQLSFRREARLLKEKRANLGLQVMLPSANGQVPKEWAIEMVRPNSLRPDASWQVNLATLPPHQMLVLILSKDSTNKFAAWNRMSALIPSSVERDGGDIEKLRYYRLVLPLEADKPALSSHPLTWSTISHAIWDGYTPDTLTFSQQQALLDWVHWGGQLTLSGGAGQAFSLLNESFLGPYLPADASGENVALSQDDLRPLSQSYPPPAAARGARRSVQIGALDQPGRSAALCLAVSGSRADPTGPETSGVSIGPAAQAWISDDSPGRRESSFDGSRKAGRARTDHDADFESQ